MMCIHGLPDMYTWPSSGVHIRQTTHVHGITSDGRYWKYEIDMIPIIVILTKLNNINIF